MAEDKYRTSLNFEPKYEEKIKRAADAKGMLPIVWMRYVVIKELAKVRKK